MIICCIALACTPILCAQGNTNSSEEVQRLLEKKRSYNLSKGFGYRIQIYYGTEEIAKDKAAEFALLFPEVPTKLVYNNPEWKVQVGNYKTKLEADRANLLFGKEFSATIVIPLGK